MQREEEDLDLSSVEFCRQPQTQSPGHREDGLSRCLLVGIESMTKE
jgi:hypothetical protein